MHYYQFHIGDYRAATSHLSNEEDLAYRRLLDMYYDTESCIPLDTQWVSRRIRIAHDVVLSVLTDMFQKTESGWFHPVCDRNLKQYIAKAETARTNGKSGGRPKKNPAGYEQEPDGKLTNNHKPITITKTKAVAVARPDDVEEAVWNDFLSLRKAKRSPLTETALERIRAQAVEAKLTLSQALQICCSRGWQGFEAGWVKPDDRKMVQVEKPGFFMGRKLSGVNHG
jgi:uncharacterized protein YdaU (DUF1376 family)